MGKIIYSTATLFSLSLSLYIYITLSSFLRYTLLVPGQAVWVLPIELLHGISFGVFSSAAVHRASELAPVGMEARAQGFTTGVRQLRHCILEFARSHACLGSRLPRTGV